MTNKSDLSIKKATIEIKVIQVDNHKMTKATFNQIIKKDFGKLDFDNIYIFGWISDKSTDWLLFSEDFKLFKSRMHYLEEYGVMPYWLKEKKKDYREKRIRIQNNYDQLFIAT